MAKKPSMYKEVYYSDERAFESPEESPILNQTPWWAISFALHAVVLLMIWSIVLSKSVDDGSKVFKAAVDDADYVEPPQIPPPPIKEEKEIELIEDPENPEEIDEKDDPTEVKDEDRRPDPNPSNVEGPYPEKGYNSSMGLGGNIGGGGGPGGGGGGFRYRKQKRGKRETDKNVLLALYWLRDHQDQTGGNWSCDNFIEQCRTNSPSPHGKVKFKREGVCSNKDGNPDIGWKMGTDGVSGLSTLAFLGAGYTHEEGEFKLTVKKALRYLQTIQTDDGCFGPKEDEQFVYNHSICTMAMSEAYAMTAVAKLKAPAQMAVEFISYAQNEDPDRGWLGWRYGVKTGESDGSVTGWMVLALKSARAANLKIPERCWEGAKRLYDDLTSNPDEEEGVTGAYPRTGYLTKGGPNARLREANNFLPNPSIDSINVLCRLFMGEKRSNSMLKAQAKLMTEEREGNLPTIDNEDKIDYYYWYYASLAMYQMGGNYWTKWEQPLIDCLTGLQRLEDKDACVYGSWDPIDAWGTAGGRVYATAINALTLEVYYRYERTGTTSDD